MKPISSKVVVFCALLYFGIYNTGYGKSPQITKNSNKERAQQVRNVQMGYQLILRRQPRKAIDQYFSPALKYFNRIYSSKVTRYQCARSQKESMYYLVAATLNRDKNNTKTITKIVGNAWCSAQFGKAYALINLKQWTNANKEMMVAVNMSPQNSNYLSELGHIAHAEKRWKDALIIFRQAERAVQYSPDKIRIAEKSRAIRGIGYSLIELGKLGEAEKELERCLRINPKDQRAINELRYIQTLRKKSN